MALALTVTPQQELRLKQEWDHIAGESLRYEVTTSSDPIYAFGSELACLRLEHTLKAGRADFSANLKTWYYVNRKYGHRAG